MERKKIISLAYARRLMSWINNNITHKDLYFNGSNYYRFLDERRGYRYVVIFTSLEGVNFELTVNRFKSSGV